jgi:hypothetical protein
MQLAVQNKRLQQLQQLLPFSSWFGQNVWMGFGFGTVKSFFCFC